MEVECPKCKKSNDIDGEDLPSDVCDAADFECIHCEHVFSIGWYATAELR